MKERNRLKAQIEPLQLKIHLTYLTPFDIPLPELAGILGRHCHHVIKLSPIISYERLTRSIAIGSLIKCDCKCLHTIDISVMNQRYTCRLVQSRGATLNPSNIC